MTGLDFYDDIFGSLDFSIMNKYHFKRVAIVQDSEGVDRWCNRRYTVYKYVAKHSLGTVLELTYHIDLYVDTMNGRNRYIDVYVKCGTGQYSIWVNDDLQRNSMSNYYEYLDHVFSQAAEHLMSDAQESIFKYFKHLALDHFVTEIHKDENIALQLQLGAYTHFIQHERRAKRR